MCVCIYIHEIEMRVGGHTKLPPALEPATMIFETSPPNSEALATA